VDVLIVDDSELVALALRRLMMQRGFTVTTARSYAEAWRAAGERDYAAAIIDLSLSDWGGLELGKRLLRENLVAGVFFFCTETCDEETLTKAGHVGRVFRKGAPARSLILAVEDVVRLAPLRSGVTRAARPCGEDPGEGNEGNEAAG
jgi:DNA-binding response OmpR family regulator